MKFLAATVLLAGLGVFAWAVERQPTVVRIGALNIEWLGMPDKRSGPAKNIAQEPRDIADYIKSSGVSVLGLEEIGDDDGVPTTYTNKTMTAAVALLNDGGQAKWKYRLFAKNPAGEHADWQLVGLAWNEAVVTPEKTIDGSDALRLNMSAPPGAGAPGKPAMERWATAMKFSTGPGKTDFVVIPVHMKSNHAAFDGQDTAAQRDVETNMLLAGLPEVRAKFRDDDIVVIGDTNILKKDEKGIATMRAAGFVDLNINDDPTYISGDYKSPFDRAFVPNPIGNVKAREFLHSKFDVFAHPMFKASEYRVRISDHRMIRMTIEVMDDDD